MVVTHSRFMKAAAVMLRSARNLGTEKSYNCEKDQSVQLVRGWTAVSYVDRLGAGRWRAVWHGTAGAHSLLWDAMPARLHCLTLVWVDWLPSRSVSSWRSQSQGRSLIIVIVSSRPFLSVTSSDTSGPFDKFDLTALPLLIESSAERKLFLSLLSDILSHYCVLWMLSGRSTWNISLKNLGPLTSWTLSTVVIWLLRHCFLLCTKQHALQTHTQATEKIRFFACKVFQTNSFRDVDLLFNTVRYLKTAVVWRTCM